MFSCAKKNTMKTQLLVYLALAFATVTAENFNIELEKRSGSQYHSLAGSKEENLQEVLKFYTGTVSIGTPPQIFALALDTLSPYTWVFSSEFENGYNHNLSSTHQLDGTEVIDHFSQGYISIDTIEINSLRIKNQPFVEKTNITIDFFFPFNGALGLGWPENNANNSLSIVQNMYLQNLIDAPVFGVYFNNHRGVVSFGAPYSEYYTDSITYINTTQQNQWKISFDCIEIKGLEIVSNIDAVVTFGLSYIDGPSAIIREINYFIGGKDLGFGLYKLDCNKVENYPTVYFNIGEETFELEPQYYTLTNGEVCWSAFSNLDEEERNDDVLIIGTAFLRKYYSVYDFENERIGFATALSE